MGIIPPAVHRVIDYVLVAIFAIAPSVLHLVGNTRLLAYGLAVVHLALTLLTQNEQGRGVIPQRVHGMIEAVVGALLVVVPFARHWTYHAGKFYPAMGCVIIAVWALSRYHRHDAVPATTAAV